MEELAIIHYTFKIFRHWQKVTQRMLAVSMADAFWARQSRVRALRMLQENARTRLMSRARICRPTLVPEKNA